MKIITGLESLDGTILVANDILIFGEGNAKEKLELKLQEFKFVRYIISHKNSNADHGTNSCYR